MDNSGGQIFSSTNVSHLKILAALFEPFIEKCGLSTLSATRNCPRPGLDAEIFEHLLRQTPGLGNTYSIQETNPDFGQMDVNGTWTDGQFKEMTRGRFDVLLTSMVITNQRYLAFELSYPVDYLPYAFVVKRFPNTFATSSRLLFDVFSNPVWISCGLLITLLVVIGVVQQRLLISCREKRRPCLSLISQAWRTYWAISRLALRQSREVPYDMSRASGVVLTFTVYLFIPLTFGLYQSALLSHLYQGSPRAPFHSVEELMNLIENGQYRLVTDKDDLSFFEDMDTTSDSVLIKIKSVVDKKLVHYVEDEQEALDFVDKHNNYVYPSTLDEASYLIKNDTCKFHIQVDTGRTQRLVYVFRKNFPSSELRRINDAIGKSWPLFEFLKNKYYLKYQEICENDNQALGKNVKWSQLSTANLGGAIYIYLLILLMATFSFLFETFYYRMYGKFVRTSRIQLKNVTDTLFDVNSK